MHRQSNVLIKTITTMCIAIALCTRFQLLCKSLVPNIHTWNYMERIVHSFQRVYFRGGDIRDLWLCSKALGIPAYLWLNMKYCCFLKFLFEPEQSNMPFWFGESAALCDGNRGLKCRPSPLVILNIRNVMRHDKLCLALCQHSVDTVTQECTTAYLIGKTSSSHQLIHHPDLNLLISICLVWSPLKASSDKDMVSRPIRCSARGRKLTGAIKTVLYKIDELGC